MKRNRAIGRGFHAPKAGALPGCATPRHPTYMILNYFLRLRNDLKQRPWCHRDKTTIEDRDKTVAQQFQVVTAASIWEYVLPGQRAEERRKLRGERPDRKATIALIFAPAFWAAENRSSWNCADERTTGCLIRTGAGSAKARFYCVSPKPNPATASRRERASRPAHWWFNSLNFAWIVS